MKKPRNNENHVHQQEAHHDLASEKKSGAVVAPASRAAYRDDYQCNYGPDLDEPLDRIESGRDF